MAGCIAAGDHRAIKILRLDKTAQDDAKAFPEPMTRAGDQVDLLAAVRGRTESGMQDDAVAPLQDLEPRSDGLFDRPLAAFADKRHGIDVDAFETVIDG